MVDEQVLLACIHLCFVLYCYAVLYERVFVNKNGQLAIQHIRMGIDYGSWGDPIKHVGGCTLKIVTHIMAFNRCN